MYDDITKKDDQNPAWFRPATDIVELEDGFHIYMDLPGVSKDGLGIDLRDNEVAIVGKTQAKEDQAGEDQDGDDKEKVIHMEFTGGEYRRTFTLSDTVDRERIEAQLKNGVLDLFLPKSEKTLPKRIEISAG
jgi:HSP20 family protein